MVLQLVSTFLVITEHKMFPRVRDQVPNRFLKHYSSSSKCVLIRYVPVRLYIHETSILIMPEQKDGLSHVSEININVSRSR
jgi:hypothetical protein